MERIRVKSSVIKNLVTILFKRLFFDEKIVSVAQMEKITSSLVAISRIDSENFISVCTEKLTAILAKSSSDQFKRVIPSLSYMPELWRYTETSIRHRIDQSIENMNILDLIHYRIASAAESIPKIGIFLERSIQGYSTKQLKELLKGSPSSILKEKAIEVFINSQSFDSAYENGVQILLKYAHYLNSSDLEKIFAGSKNNGAYNINQILNAGKISDFFAALYSETKSKHSDLWVKFRADILKLEYEFTELNIAMIADGAILEDDA